MVAVDYRRWSFTKGSNCHSLTGKVLPVFWIGTFGGGRTLRFDYMRYNGLKPFMIRNEYF